MKKDKSLNEAQENPRIKSIQLSGARLAVSLARKARSSSSLEEMIKISTAQSTIAVAMTIVASDVQRANRLIDMARSIANGNAKEEQDGREEQ